VHTHTHIHTHTHTHTHTLLDNKLRVDLEYDGVGFDETLEIHETDALEVGQVWHAIVAQRRHNMCRIEHGAGGHILKSQCPSMCTI
jgi:hypothetical protein